MSAIVANAPPKADAATMGQWQLIARHFARHKLAVWSLNVLVLLYLSAIFAPLLAPHDPARYDVDHAYCPPQLPRWNFREGLHAPALEQIVDPVTLRKSYVERDDAVVPLRFFARGYAYRLLGIIPFDRHLLGVDRDRSPDATFHPLGADRYGRDLLSRILVGSRISLSVGLIGVAVTFLIGVSVGGISGYAGGRTDALIQRVIEVINSFPHLPLWLALGALLPADWSPLRVYFAITMLLSLLGWTGLARVVRGKILSLREEDYAIAARLMGASHTRILFRHLLPGFTSHIIVTLSLAVPAMILGETSLSFLGLGLRPPVISWGVLLQDCLDVGAIRYYTWLLCPVPFVIVTVLAFNFVGDGLRDAADPYASR
jgi:peptide/nickel transport system permease protein